MSTVFRKKDKKGKEVGSYIWVGDDPAGKQVWKSTKQKSLDLAKQVQHDFDEKMLKYGTLNEDITEKEGITFERYFSAKYLPNYAAEQAPLSTVKLKIAANWFTRLAQPGRMDTITRETFATFKTRLLAQVYEEGARKGLHRLRPSSANAVLRCIKPIFGAAHADNYIETNPAYKIKMIPELKTKAKWLEREALDSLLVHAKNDVERIKPVPDGRDASADIALAMLLEQDTGMRLDEIMHQRIEDIDLEGGWLEVRLHANGRQGEGCRCFACRRKALPGWHTKNRMDRSIPLTPRLRQALQDIRKRRKIGCIFEWAPSTISKGVKRCYVRLGLLGRNHTFRHSLKTEMRRADMDETVINNILGHGDRGVADRYDHTSKAEMKEEFQKLLSWRDQEQKKILQSKLNVI